MSGTTTQVKPTMRDAAVDALHLMIARGESDMAADQARWIAHTAPPSEADHEQAEMRGVYLCEECGAELRYPKDPQLCGRCEEATFIE